MSVQWWVMRQDTCIAYSTVLIQLCLSDGLYVQHKEFFLFISIYQYCRKSFFREAPVLFWMQSLTLQRAEDHTTGCHHEGAEIFPILRASPELWHLTWTIKIVILQPASREKSSRMPSVCLKIARWHKWHSISLFEFEVLEFEACRVQTEIISYIFSGGNTEPKVQL